VENSETLLYQVGILRNTVSEISAFFIGYLPREKNVGQCLMTLIVP
jgi:hypothetical protein